MLTDKKNKVQEDSPKKVTNESSTWSNSSLTLWLDVDRSSNRKSNNYRTGGNRSFSGGQRSSRSMHSNNSKYRGTGNSCSFNKVLLTKRVDRVIPGGRNTSFIAMVVVGNNVDRMGVGSAKSRTIIESIANAKLNAEKNIIIPGNINYMKTTHCKTTLIIKKRSNNVTRAVNYLSIIFKACGLTNLSCKIIGSNNNINAIKALIRGLKDNIHRKMCMKMLKNELKNNEEQEVFTKA